MHTAIATPSFLATGAEIWASVGTIVATLVLVLVPALVYTWYVLEQMIDDEKSYEPVIASVDRRRDPHGDS